MMNTPNLESYLGFLALGAYIITLLPTILRIVFPATKKTLLPKLLLKYRRQIGVISFFLGTAHGILLFMKRNFDIWDVKAYYIYLQGFVLLAIFTVLAITSNDWSVKKLKKNWRQLHQLTYLAMFLLVWHVGDKMFDHWTYITPLAITGILGITILFIIRKWIEYKQKITKSQDKIFANKS
ncbi:MAG: ferric reductase-like transmembrane domain-containing protein [Microcoleaceae cyanobacterium]